MEQVVTSEYHMPHVRRWFEKHILYGTENIIATLRKTQYENEGVGRNANSLFKNITILLE